MVEGGNGMVMGSKSQMIADILWQKISSGECSGRLPAEQELARQFAVSPVTASKALNILRDKGIVTRMARQGTFVIPLEKKVLKIRFSDIEFVDMFKKYVEEKFRDVQIDTVNCFEEADAAICASTLPFFPGEYFLPVPRERLLRLRESGRFFPQIFEFFNLCGMVWNVPFVFSPDILLYNKKIMQQIASGFSPYELTFEMLLELQKKLPGGVHLFAGQGEALMLSFIYNLSGDTCGIDVYRKAADMLSCFDCGGDFSDFLAGKVLFATAFRSKCRRLTKDFDVAPMPEINGKRLCHTASQTFWVRHSTLHADLLFEIWESLFDPAFQQKIAALHGNISADASIASAAMDSRFIRDDIFFNEIKNMDFSHRHMQDAIASCFSSALKKLVCSYISPGEFLKEVEEGLLYESKRRQTLREYFNWKEV